MASDSTSYNDDVSDMDISETVLLPAWWNLELFVTGYTPRLREH